MKDQLQFWVVGGDMRQAKLAQLLSQDGHQVQTFALEEAVIPEGTLSIQQDLAGLERADCVILPLPILDPQGRLNSPLSQLHPEAQEVIHRLHPGQIVMGGRVEGVVAQLAMERGLVIRDYWEREELAVANGIPTVEGAIQLAMEHMPITIHDSKALVLGFGRIGALLAHRLVNLGAHVSVAARRPEALTWAKALGCQGLPLDQLSQNLSSYDLVLNTVPALILTQTELSQLPPHCLILDLASKPGGVDLEAAAWLGRTVIWALSLPGKVAPVTAGAAIQHTIYHMLRELNT